MDKEMFSVELNLKTYLSRIGYEGSLDVTEDTLSQLQSRHLHTVPYENFDILNGIPLSLEIDDLFKKIVVQHRGGYCFELNALFGWLLQEMGFKVTHYFARFWRDEPNTPPKRRHHILKVEVEEKAFLCDVGVGGIVPLKPIEMVEEKVQIQGNEHYKLERDANFGWVLCEEKQGEWQWIYSFTEEVQLPKDYIMASFWCEHAPDSIFNKAAMAAIRTPEGRNSLSDREFRIFTEKGVEVFTPESEAAYREALKTYFGIVLNG
jgi:N-hydroxyarylamine O-acetyltransferase